MQVLDEALHLLDRAPKPGKRVALVLTVTMHVLLALVLFYGVRWQSSFPEAVEVELVRAGPPAKAESPPAPAPEAPVPPKPQAEVKPPPPKPAAPVKPDIAIKEKPEKKLDPKVETKPQYDPMQEMLKRESEQQREQQQRKQLSDALAKEESANKAATQSASQSAARNKGLADYSAKIRGKVRGNLMVPPGISGNPEAEFLVTQLPSGEVIEVVLRKSSGQKALDDAIERAIRKSSPLPPPDRKEDFQRDLKLQFRPLEQAPGN